jgi:uncharacterized iron-regulated protein
MNIRYLALTTLLCPLTLAMAASPSQDSSQDGCAAPGHWLLPPASQSASPRPPQSLRSLFDAFADKSVVLLGECHDCADDHRWQLQMLMALYELHPDMAIGFEMFPRRLQPVLDRWVAGELNEAEFLRQAEWEKVWNYNPHYYMPLFEFARQHHLPMLALNVDHELVDKVRANGWEAVPTSQREGVGQPAAPAASYKAELKAIFDAHPLMGKQQDKATQFDHFVEAQALWDRAMAEGMANFRQNHPKTLVVGILGAGHVQDGYGVPHQLRALGIQDVASLLTVPSDHPCSEITPHLADAVFVVPPQPQETLFPRPRLGVGLGEAPGGVEISMVFPGSLAEKSGIKKGDVVLKAAGSKVDTAEDFRGYVMRQPAGTWLPLLIRRGSKTQQIVVRFPPEPDPSVRPHP